MQTGLEFFTATCLNWQPLLAVDAHKQIVMNSLEFLIREKRIWLYGYVIMPNHIHLLWRKQDDWLDKSVQQQFLKFTAQHIKFNLLEHFPQDLEKYREHNRTGHTISGSGGLTKRRCSTEQYVSRS